MLIGGADGTENSRPQQARWRNLRFDFLGAIFS
jgi:hypothetical protein